ncbi:hypothetical protein ACVI1L_005069 [Bradyrhizobium sp. USDA 4516]
MRDSVDRGFHGPNQHFGSRGERQPVARMFAPIPLSQRNFGRRIPPSAATLIPASGSGDDERQRTHLRAGPPSKWTQQKRVYCSKHLVSALTNVLANLAPVESGTADAPFCAHELAARILTGHHVIPCRMALDDLQQI